MEITDPEGREQEGGSVVETRGMGTETQGERARDPKKGEDRRRREKRDKGGGAEIQREGQETRKKEVRQGPAKCVRRAPSLHQETELPTVLCLL